MEHPGSMRFLILVSLSLGLAGCVSDGSQWASTDDQTCQGYGAKPGSDIYVQCRMSIQDQRRAAADQMGAALMGIGGAMMAGSYYRPRTCVGAVHGGAVVAYC